MAFPSQTVLWINTLARSNENDFYCFICADEKTFPTWQEHITDATHVATLTQFNLTFETRSERLRCRMCDEYLHWDGVRNHGKFHSLVPWHEPDDKYRRFFQNGIVGWKENFYCCPCDVVFPDWSVALCHVSERTHDERKKEISSLGQFSDTIPVGQTQESLVLQGFVPHDRTTLECKFCKNEKIQFPKITEHVKSFTHWRNRLKFAPRGYEKKKKTADTGPQMIVTNIGSTEQRPSFGPMVHWCYFEKLNDKCFICRVCGSSIFSCEENTKVHLASEFPVDSLQKYGCDNISSSESDIDNSGCCNVSIPIENSIHLRINEEIHADSTVLSSSTIKPPSHNETIDEIVTPTPRSCVSEIVDRNPTNICIFRLNATEWHCKLCETRISDSLSIKTHVEDSAHAAAVTKYGCNFVSIRERSFYHCQCCDCVISGHHNVYFHITGRRHSLVLNISSKQQRNCTSKIIPEKTSKPEPLDSRKTLSSTINEPPKVPKRSKSRMYKKRSRPSRAHKNCFEDVEDEEIVCKLCNVVLPDDVELHSHLASHFVMEFQPPCMARNTSDKNNNSRSEKIGEKMKNVAESGQLLPIDLDAIKSTKMLNKYANNKVPSDRKTCDSNVNYLPGHSTFSESRPINSSDESCSYDEISSNDTSGFRPKTTMQNILKRLNLNKDYIYDMKEKCREIDIGMKLSITVDSTTVYCLICRKNVVNNLQNYFEHLCDLDHNYYLELMEKDHALFEIAIGQFSELDLALQYMEEISDELLRCLICNKNIVNDDYAVHCHTVEHDHEIHRDAMHVCAKRRYDDVKSRIHCDWYSVQKYWCVPCSENFINEFNFVNHLKSNKHNMVASKWENVEKTMIYDFCPTCALLWYGYRCTYAYHCDLASHKWLLRDGHYVVRNLPESAKKLLASPEKFNDYANDLRKNGCAKERERELKLLRDLENSVKSKFRKPKAYVYGSRASGLQSPDSNIDIFLDCGNMYKGNIKSKLVVLNLIADVQKCLDEDSQLWDVNEILTECRYPVIRASHRVTELLCDISLTNGIPVENTKLVKSFINAFPPCRDLMLFLKQWLVLCGLSGSDRISTYALCWLVIFYLQKESIFPSIAELMVMSKKSRFISDWEVGVSDVFSCDESHINYRLKELLIRFFTFYGDFDFRYNVACPLIGKVMKKRAFAVHRKLPKEMAPYVAYIDNSDDPEPLRVDVAMCIQDPFDLQHNITESVSKVFLCRFRNCCSKSLDILCSP